MSTESPFRIAVVIVSYNSAAHIERLLDSLPLAFGSIRSWRIIVVDNGSTDCTVDIVRARTDCTLIQSTNVGYGAGLNIGVEHSGTPDYVLVLNPDTTLGVGSIPTMLSEFARPTTGVVVPKVLESNGELSLSLRRDPTLCRVGGLSFTKRPRFSEIIYERDAYSSTQVVDWAMGAVMLVSRSCWDQLQGFDESFFMYSEETDFCLRARDLGWLIRYTPDAVVIHVGGGSGESPATHSIKMVNRVRLFRRRHSTLASFLYFVMAVVTEFRRAVLGHRASWVALRALVQPSRRPAQINCGNRLLPI